MKELPTREWLIENGFPYGKGSDTVPKGDPKTEFQRTDPDVILFNPGGQEAYEGDNEHLLVFESPSGNGLLAIWTQSSCEATGDNHIVMARSHDGETWSEPSYVVGARRGKLHGQASWAFPVIAKNGRIYLFYTRQLEIWDNSHCGSGALGCIYSDDEGKTWSGETQLPMVASKYDNPDSRYPKNWIVWQKPIRDRNGKHMVGYTLVTSGVHGVIDKTPGRWVNADSRCYFMRFENLDEAPDPRELKITWLPDDDAGIAVKNAVVSHLSTAQEPAIVLLPNGNLFCVMRTMTGCVYYSVSKDNGHHWCPALPLRYHDDGPLVTHPMSPCPLYRLEQGRYLIAFHNNTGERLGHSQWKDHWDGNEANFFRNPLYIAIGEYRPESQQPLVFGKPYRLLDTGDVAVGPKATAETGTYTSVTEFGGEIVFWYPDRKYYLLGKRLPQSLIDTLKPE
ncbi:exo-alpha-sialidase [bacterium]|nr:exo-alpha-sialidase [bacterium]